METKHLIVLGLIAAFFLGAGASGVTKAFTAPDAAIATPVAAASPAVASPAFAPRRAVSIQPAVRDTVVVREPAPVVKKKRSLGKEALIVGGSAGAGAAIGAVAGGKKGAAVGAVSGGVAGLIYDIATRNK
jgi:hypothetical protein